MRKLTVIIAVFTILCGRVLLQNSYYPSGQMKNGGGGSGGIYATTTKSPTATKVMSRIYGATTKTSTSRRTYALSAVYRPKTYAQTPAYSPRTQAPPTARSTRIYAPIPQTQLPLTSASTSRSILPGGNEVPFCSTTGYNCYRCLKCRSGGWCVKDGLEPRCLCFYGWTGRNSVFVESPSKRNLVRADSCNIVCYYTPFVRNPRCARNIPRNIQRTTTQITARSTARTNPPRTPSPTTTTTTTTITRRYTMRTYPATSVYNRHTLYYRRSTHSPQTTRAPKTSGRVTYTSTTKRDPGNSMENPVNPMMCAPLRIMCIRCDDICGSGGLCIKRNDGQNARCLCYYGWTGPNAVFSRKDTRIRLARNRVEAEHCKTPCHYTPYRRNLACAQEPSSSQQAVPPTQSYVDNDRRHVTSRFRNAYKTPESTTTSAPTTKPFSYRGHHFISLSKSSGYRYPTTSTTKSTTSSTTSVPTTNQYRQHRGLSYRTNRGYQNSLQTRSTAATIKTTTSPMTRRTPRNRGLSYRNNNDENNRSLQMSNPSNPAVCRALGLDCVHCETCGAGGWCVVDAISIKLRCLCVYGFTGYYAEYIPDSTEFPYFLFAKNRIRAKDCKRQCHYSYSHRNPHCVHDLPSHYRG